MKEIFVSVHEKHKSGEQNKSRLRSELAASVRTQAEYEQLLTRFQDAELRERAWSEISTLAAQTTELENFFPAIHKIVASLTYAENLYVALYDAETDLVRIPYFVDTCDALPEALRAGVPSEQLGRSVTAYVIRTRETLVAGPQDLKDLAAAGEITIKGTLPKQWIGLPLLYNKAMIGAVIVQSYIDGVQYSERDIALLRFMSRELAANLGRLQARQTLRRKHAELQRAFQSLENAQARLLQSEKMASIGRLASGVAHELNNPLSFVLVNLQSLQGNLDLIAKFSRLSNALQTGVRDADATRQANAISALEALQTGENFSAFLDDLAPLLRETINGAERIRDIVARVHAFADAGDAQRHPADINQCIENALQRVRSERKFSCELRTSLAPMPNIVCHSGQIEQVIAALLLNAIDAVQGDGLVSVHSDLDGGHVRVRVSDTGKGITQEDVANVFSPFFTTKPVGQGVGLGLSVCYGIIDAHGGELTVISEVDQGSTFSILLPIRPAQRRDAADHHHEPA